MMAVLENNATKQTLVSNLEVATTFWTRGKGLLGRSGLLDDQALWIHHCNSIHTCFMKFAIDCVFVDKKMKVQVLRSDVRPWRVIGPFWKASSVIEMPAGTIRRLNIQVGDELYVGT
jgi:uncharacterized membrane protein (UPF0127 family)